jgi:hypothetical protein
MKNTLNQKENKELKEWKARFQAARDAYADQRNEMKKFSEYYHGTRVLQDDPNSGRSSTKKATNVRNITYELVESQVDASIPMPKVRAIHADDDELAKKIERMLENKVKTCKLEELNDFMERVTPVQGGDFFHVQWDNHAGLHSSVGDVKVTEVHPMKLIPQPGVSFFDNMDYFFIQEIYTKKTVKRIYGVDVSDAENDDQELLSEYEDSSTNDQLVTVNTAYYRNDHDGIGVYVWCDVYELMNLEDYQSRYFDHCAKCGSRMVDGVCPSCGSKKAVKEVEDDEELLIPIDVRVDGAGVDENGNPVTQHVEPVTVHQAPLTDENGMPVLDEMGNPQTYGYSEKTRIPYYKPKVFPIILRRNVSEENKFLGASDVNAIIDQQDTIKKLGTKINEKLLKGGSYVTLPRDVDVDKSDKELKIIRLDNAAQKGLIDVINIQPNVQYDENYLETNYQWAKSTLGITDSYQGKYDASATSGTAKQYAINQAAGRLESKKVQKNAAYSELYKLIFRFWLAYADDTTEITTTDSNGNPQHEEINRYDFLKIDSNGEYYWDDEFIFETDPTSTLMANREAMWNQTDLKLQSQAFGPLGDMETLRTYWTFMKASGYPNAGMALDIVEQRINEQKEQEQQMMEMQMQQGAQNPQNGAENTSGQNSPPNM